VLTPALFIDGERYRGELEPAAVSAALEANGPEAARLAGATGDLRPGSRRR
jgi:hypothetical protein